MSRLTEDLIGLKFRVLFALDATLSFDRRALDGEMIPAEELSRVTAANLNGEFATITGTAELVAAVRLSRSS